MSKQFNEFAIPLWLQIAASLILAVFIFLHLRYPHLVIDNIVVALLILLLVVWIFPYVKSFTLPGGAGATPGEQPPQKSSRSIQP